jgi:hypothetical protein
MHSVYPASPFSSSVPTFFVTGILLFVGQPKKSLLHTLLAVFVAYWRCDVIGIGSEQETWRDGGRESERERERDK